MICRMTDQRTNADDVVRGAIEGVSRAYEDARTAIAGVSDGQQAFDRATELVELLQGLGTSAAGFRAQVAQQIYETEKLSLAGLANRISVSRSRAGQLLDTAKKVNSASSPD